MPEIQKKEWMSREPSEVWISTFQYITQTNKGKIYAFGVGTHHFMLFEYNLKNLSHQN